jgi:peroxiredoxin
MKRLYDVEITREVTYTVCGVSANTPEEAESIAEQEDFQGMLLESSDVVSAIAYPSDEEDDEPSD